MNTASFKIVRWISGKLTKIAKALCLRSAASVKPAKFVDLAPTEQADQGGVYAAALKFATDSSNVSNIALTGPYGSGKSSIIRTFLKCYPRQALHISLAAFLPEGGDDRRKVTKQEIERSILQQMLYGADSDKLPLSRFKRIQSPRFRSIFRSLYILTGLLSLWHLFNKRTALFDGSYFKPFDLTNWVGISMSIYAFIFLWSVIHHFYIASFGVSLKSISLKDIEMRPSSDDQDSILNRHLDEIVYFFQVTRYDLVVVEDLDRFEDSDIFVTLREINSLVNGNVGVRRKIRFLYALRDDMFTNTDRTKFFEFIIPVVPIINSSNSIDMMLAQGKRLELDGRLDQQFLREVSRYLSDLRLIHNIFNEYAIYVANLETDGENVLDPTKLLAVLIYKNVYPKDFELLHRGSGDLAGVLGRKDELIAIRDRSYRSEIAALQRDIEVADKEVAKDLRELKRIYAMMLIETLPPDVTSVGLTSNDLTPLQNLSGREDIERLITAPTHFYYIPHYGTRQQNNATLQRSSASEEGYGERVLSIEQKADARKKAAQQRIAHLKSEMKAIRTSKFNVLLQSNLSEVEGIFESFGNGGQLARFLLLEGYLDDSYYQYTSLFHSGRLSPNDNKFLIQIRAFQTPDPLFPIDNPSEVIAGMREDDFDLDYALNVRLVDALLRDNSHRERLRRVYAYLSNQFPNQQEFFETYYSSGSHVGELLKQLVDVWRDFVPAAIEASLAALHIARLIEHLPAHMLARERNEHPEFQKFVADNLGDILPLLEGVDTNKFEELQIEAKDLAAIDGYPNVVHKLYELGHYRLNDANFDYIFGSILGKESGHALRKRHYSAVRESGSEPLLTRVENNFEAYFLNVLLDMPDDDEEDIDAILAVMAHDTLDAAKVEIFIMRQIKVLPTIEDVPERYHSVMFRENCISPTWSNCLDFIRSVAFQNDALITFLSDEFVRANLLQTPIQEDEEAEPLRQFLVRAEDLGDEDYRAYVKALPKQTEKFPEALSTSKRQILIDERRVTFDAQNFAALNGELDLQVSFIIRNIRSYLDDPSPFSVDDMFRERLLISDISDSEKRGIIDLMELSDLSGLPERAGIIGPILLRTNVTPSSLTPDIAKAIIVNTKPVDMQVRLLNLLHENLDKSEIREVLRQLPDPYSRIQTGYGRPALCRTEYNSELVRWLDARDIISSVGKSLWSDDIMVNLYRS